MNGFEGVMPGTAITTALQSVATQATGVIADVAPIGITIMGVFLVWKLGIKAFKSIASK